MSVNKEEAVKRCGDMLLGGWKMLNTSCPVCNTAIMSKGGRFHCPGCDAPVMTEAEAAFMAEENAKRGAALRGNGDPVEKPVKSLEEEKKAYDLKRGKANMISSKIGEHLLLGFALLGQECPRDTCAGIPLMQKKGEKPYCVNCENLFVTDTYGSLIPEAHMNSKPSAPAAPAASQASSLTDALAMFREKEKAAAAAASSDEGPILDLAAVSSKVDASALIGQKLLQGWALLEETCPSCCSVPLMQDLKKEMYCVSCGYINQPKKAAAPFTRPPQAPVAAPKIAPSSASIGDEDLDELLDDDIVESYNQSRISDLQNKGRVSQARSTVTAGRKAGNLIEGKLQQKLQWAVAELDACYDIQMCIELTKLVSELSAAIASTRKNGL